VKHCEESTDSCEDNRASSTDSERFNMNLSIMGSLFVAFGLFAICGAGFDWDWFMIHRKARFFVAVFTRTGARIFYMLLGGGLVTLGVLMMLGVIRSKG